MVPHMYSPSILIPWMFYRQGRLSSVKWHKLVKVSSDRIWTQVCVISAPMDSVYHLEGIGMAQGRVIHTTGRWRRQRRKPQAPVSLTYEAEGFFSSVLNGLFLLNDLSADLTSVFGLVSVSVSGQDCREWVWVSVLGVWWIVWTQCCLNRCWIRGLEGCADLSSTWETSKCYIGLFPSFLCLPLFDRGDSFEI